jgi:hypothetical protein
MKLFHLFTKEKKKEKTQNTKEENVRRFGAEQFKTLAKKGLSVPVVLL